MSDLTGWCERGHHDTCTGTLRAATGHHWWCVCSCHPEPPNATKDEKKAHAIWTAGTPEATDG